MREILLTGLSEESTANIKDASGKHQGGQMGMAHKAVTKNVRNRSEAQSKVMARCVCHQGAFPLYYRTCHVNGHF